VANLSLREAVKHFEVSRPTLQKALKSGKISGGQDGQGHWQVDPAELARVYRPRPAWVANAEGAGVVNLATQNRALPGKDDWEVSALKAELAQERVLRAVAEALADERARHIDDLRRLLPPPDAKPRRWWPW
jgi:transposase